MSVKLPSNHLKHPIKRLIENLQSLPEGTTYETEDDLLWGGETLEHDLGTGYQYTVKIVEGFNPPRDLEI